MIYRGKIRIFFKFPLFCLLLHSISFANMEYKFVGATKFSYLNSILNPGTGTFSTANLDG